MEKRNFDVAGNGQIKHIPLHVSSFTKIKVERSLYRGSYMSAHVLLNLLNRLGKKKRCEALLSILLVFPNKFNKFSNTGA